jgi:hypothetical protein
MRTQKTTTAQNQINHELNDSMMLQANTNQSWEAKQAAKAVITTALQATHPDLKGGQDCVTAAKNIRIELKNAFPQIKFSVTTSKFAGGNSVRVGWIDGVTVEEVDQIANKYKGGTFDGSDDLYTYSDTAWMDAFGSAKYISTSREYSAEFVGETIAEIGAIWHDGKLPTALDYRNGSLYSVSPSRHCETWLHLIYRAMVRKSA